MKDKAGALKTAVLILTLALAAVLAGCSGKSATLTGVKSIVIEQQAIEIEGHKETVTVMPDGLLEQESSAADAVSSEKSVISPDDFTKLVKILEKNRFTELPDDVSTDSRDGAILTITVETEAGTYRKSGLNPDNKDFMNCYQECMELLQ